MLDAEYAIQIFERHYNRAKSYLPPRFTVLELGPGDSLATSIIASTHGALKIYLVDVGSFASMKLLPYNQIRQRLAARMPTESSPLSFQSISEMLVVTNTTYLTSGLRSLKTIPDNSIDFVFSQAVLEHVALSEFEDTIRQQYRLQAPGGIASHEIDLQDHLAHSLNSLRIAHFRWESNLFASSGFYTNRLRASQIHDIFTAVGYRLLNRRDYRWSTIPISRAKLRPEFNSFTDDDLIIRGMDLVVQK